MQFILKEKEHDEFRKKLSRKTKLSTIKVDVFMFLVSIVTTVLGVYCAYFAYLKLGIDSMLNLCTFILGITLAVIGLQRTFDWLGSMVEKLSGVKLPVTRNNPEEYDFLEPAKKSCKIDISEDDIKISQSMYSANMSNNKLELTPEIEDFISFNEVIVLADRSKRALILLAYDVNEDYVLSEEKDTSFDKAMKNLSYSFYISDKWFTLSDDYRTVVEKLQNLLPKGHFAEYKELHAETIFCNPYFTFESLNEFYELAGDWEEQPVEKQSVEEQPVEEGISLEENEDKEK